MACTMIGSLFGSSRPAPFSAPLPAPLPALHPALLPALGLALLLAGCSGTIPAPREPAHQPPPRHVPRPRPAPTYRLPPARPRPAPTIQSSRGLETVIGADAESLVRQFGQPRLDIHEEDARKMQWSGTACILDVYLYPAQGSARPIATYVDARRGDGREVDRPACVTALRRP